MTCPWPCGASPLLLPACCSWVYRCGLLGGGRALDEAAWIQVPFVGLAFTVFVLQALVHIDVPVRWGIVILLGAVMVLWAFWLWRGRLRTSLRNWPRVGFAVALGVLLIQSAGLLAVGPKLYAGRALTDEFNYTAMAECLRDEGFSISEESLGQRPWLLRVATLKELRIGQSVLQAYHAVLTGQDTRDLFMPTILLCGPLLVLALFAAARVLGLAVWPAALAAAFGGLAPGVTILALECFQSQALVIPQLLLLPTVLALYNERRDVAHLGVAALCYGNMVSIYAEFLPLMGLLLAFFLLHASIQQPSSWWHLSGFACLLVGPVFFNPYAIHSVIAVFELGIDHPFILAEFFPWSYKPACLAAIWSGDFPLHYQPHVLRGPAIWGGAAVAVGGAMGLVALCLQTLRRGTAAGAWGLPVALLGLAALPGAMMLKDREHPYQFYKVLVTVSPLLALGLTGWACSLARYRPAGLKPSPIWRRVVTAGVCSCVGLGVFVAGAGSLLAAAMSAQDFPRYRSAQHMATDHDFLALRDYLASVKGQNIVYRAPAGLHGYQHFWIMYFARHNQLWLTEPWHNDAVKLETTGCGAAFLDLGSLPADCLVLSPRHSMFLQPPRDLPAANLVWQSGEHLVWRPPATPWAALADVRGAAVAGQTDDHQILLKSDPTLLRVYASQSGWVDLCLDLIHECADRKDDGAGMVVVYPSGSEEWLDFAPGKFRLHFAVERGLNDLRIHAQGLAPSSSVRLPVGLVVRGVVWEATQPDKGGNYPYAR